MTLNLQIDMLAEQVVFNVRGKDFGYGYNAATKADETAVFWVWQTENLSISSLGDPYLEDALSNLALSVCLLVSLFWPLGFCQPI